MEIENKVTAVEAEGWKRIIINPTALAVYRRVRIEKSPTIMVSLNGVHQ